jgi:hypothetical protein
VPILARATPPATTEGGSRGASSSGLPSSGPMGPGMMGPGLLNSGVMGPGLMGPLDDATKKNLTTLTRTDFLIQFVWQPPKPEEMPKTPDDWKARREEVIKAVTEAEKSKSAVTMPREEALEVLSRNESQKMTSVLGNPAAATAPGTPGAVAPGAAPAPGAPK